jgi:hypothetical protein
MENMNGEPHAELVQAVHHARIIADRIQAIIDDLDPQSEAIGYLQQAYNHAYEAWQQAHNDLMNVL